ncbi:nucleic acid-binding protein [Lentibacillus lipolyticus]|nr:nucleic acid-binding protein [Lentibacillus lipolyticus]
MTITAKYCAECDRLYHFDKYHCMVCFSKNLEEKELNGRGEVYSFTKIHAAPKRFATLAPYNIILVDLEEGLRLTARYEGDELAIGKQVIFSEKVDGAYVFR